MVVKLPLAGVRVHISGSNPNQNEDISLFVQNFSARIFCEGGVVIHDSHPSLIAPLEKAARRFIDTGGESSAAPTYFDESVWEGPITPGKLLDGDAWANNPILPAPAEAVQHLQIPLDRIDALSVGPLSSESDFTESLGKGKAGCALKSADLFFAAQEHGALTLAESFLGPTRHVRVNQQTPLGIKLDESEAIEDMATRGNDVGKEHFIEVRSRFFDSNHAEKWTRR